MEQNKVTSSHSYYKPEMYVLGRYISVIQILLQKSGGKDTFVGLAIITSCLLALGSLITVPSLKFHLCLKLM